MVYCKLWKAWTMNDHSQPQNNGLGRWLWLKILASGVVMFFLIEQALMTTSNINYIPSLLVIGTFTVPVSFLILLYTRDKSPRVSVGSLLIAVLWGGVLGTVVAGSLEYATVLRLGTLSTISIGVIEEAAKLLVPALLIARNKHYTAIDALVIGAAAGAGFAALESMGYGLTALLLSAGDINTTVHVLLLRGLMAPAAHMTWTAILAAALWRVMRGTYKYSARHFSYAFITVAIIHALWDSDTPLGTMMYVLLGLTSLGWLLLQLHKAADMPLRTAPTDNRRLAA
jgi:RsiW-degrading membrane proteinase PrsW (M82 family)